MNISQEFITYPSAIQIGYIVTNGDSYDNALAENMKRLYNAEVTEYLKGQSPMILRIFILLSVLNLSACSFSENKGANENIENIGPDERVIAAGLKARELALSPYQQDPKDINTYRNLDVSKCTYVNRAESLSNETYDSGMDDSWICKFRAESSRPSKNEWEKSYYSVVFVRTGHPDGTIDYHEEAFELESLTAQEDWRKMKPI